MTKLRLAVVSLLLIAGGAVPWLIERESKIRLQDRIKSLETQMEQLNESRTENERLAGGVAQADAASIKEESPELLRLRGEVGLLRKQTNELSKLLAENRPLQPNDASAKSQPQPGLAAGDLVSVESLAFAGYATPEAAFQSTLWADAKGDSGTFLQGFTPERRVKEEKGIAGKSESELADRAAERATHFAGANVRILNSRLVSIDEAQLTVFLSTENDLHSITAKKIDSEWKISSRRKLSRANE